MSTTYCRCAARRRRVPDVDVVMVEPEDLEGIAALQLRGMVREALDPFGCGASAMIPVADARPTCIVGTVGGGIAAERKSSYSRAPAPVATALVLTFP